MARYTVQTPTGPKRKTIYGKEREEVADKLIEALSNRNKGLAFEADNLRLDEYLGRWLADSVRDTVRPTTFERYEQLVRLHISPVLGKLKLKNLTSAHVRGLYRQKLDDGLSPRTVQYIHVTLHKVLKQAVGDGLIPRNVTETVKPPQVRREEMRPLSADQVKALFETAKGDRFEALYILAVTTGLRQGELLGLKWDDIDLEAGTLQVRRTLTTAKGGPVLSPPKTKGSRRTVKLSQTALDALRSHLERQLRRSRPGGRPVARERSHLRLRERRAAKPPASHRQPLQALAQADGIAEDTLPRPQAHVRHPAADDERQSQGRLGNVGACNHSHYPRHLLARPAQHARERRRCDGGRPYLERGGVKVVSEAWRERCASISCSNFTLICRTFSQ
jgi:integrase